jgi:DNA mismatch repair protein MutS
MQPAMTALAEIDVFNGLSLLMKEHENYQGHYCFSECISSSTPSLEMHDFWSPFVNAQKVITNSITLGTHNERLNAVITGPNAGGKSTAIKAIAANIIMAQSLGIACGSLCRLTKFAHISSCLNVIDDIGQGNSLFKSEVLRAYELVKRINNLRPGEFSFTVLDEMFNGTSYKEGSAAAYSVAKHVGASSQSICLLATHFPLLNELEKETPSFTNYKVAADVLADGSIHQHYKLEKGCSHQNIALDIIAHEGFDNDIVVTAQTVLKEKSQLIAGL